MKEYAIRENHLYVKCYTKGIKHITPTVSVFVLKDYAARRLMKENPQKEYLNRIGFSATPKLGHAVTRNRCKRIMRAAYRRLISCENVKKGNLIVISARDGAVSATSDTVYTDLSRAFAKLGLTESGDGLKIKNK